MALVNANLPIFNAGTLIRPMKFSMKASRVSFVSRLSIHASAGSETPCPVGDDPNAKAVAHVQRDGLHNPVLDDQPFRLQDNKANIGVAGASRLCKIQGTSS